MEYTVTIDKFEGPLDLLLHLIKQDDINIFDISIVKITEQYLNYINSMDKLNLNIASEYLVMAAELIEMKSKTLLPNQEVDEDDYEEDPKEKLINRLLEYQQYKDLTSTFKNLEVGRKNFYTKDPSDLTSYDVIPNKLELDISLDDLVKAFNEVLKRHELNKPLSTKVTKKEYSVSVRSREIIGIVKNKKRVDFVELFDNFSKNYIVVTFLSILDLAKKQELSIEQENNFNKIYLISR